MLSGAEEKKNRKFLSSAGWILLSREYSRYPKFSRGFPSPTLGDNLKSPRVITPLLRKIARENSNTSSYCNSSNTNNRTLRGKPCQRYSGAEPQRSDQYLDPIRSTANHQPCPAQVL